MKISGVSTDHFTLTHGTVHDNTVSSHFFDNP